jgi:hypothetical protein
LGYSKWGAFLLGGALGTERRLQQSFALGVGGFLGLRPKFWPITDCFSKSEVHEVVRNPW